MSGPDSTAWLQDKVRKQRIALDAMKGKNGGVEVIHVARQPTRFGGDIIEWNGRLWEDHEHVTLLMEDRNRLARWVSELMAENIRLKRAMTATPPSGPSAEQGGR